MSRYVYRRRNKPWRIKDQWVGLTALDVVGDDVDDVLR